MEFELIDCQTADHGVFDNINDKSFSTFEQVVQFVLSLFVLLLLCL